MPAYSRTLVRHCQRSGCDRKAVVEVFNSVNEKMGEFCARHGEETVEVLNR